MTVNKSGVSKVFLIILVLINIMIQALLYIFTKGINSQLFLSVLVVSCVLLYSIIFLLRTDHRIPKLPLFVIVFFIISLYLVTLVYSPRYTYTQAKTALRENFSNETAFNFVELDMVTINTEEPYNRFVSKGYIVGVTISSEETYYLINPYDGSITKTDFLPTN